MKRSVLIVEDELSIATLISYHVRDAGFETDIAHDGEQALYKFNKYNYDLVILDLMLPKIDGLSVCQEIRAENTQVPILMVTAKTEEDERIKGLNLGADDYITKPFSPKELVARIHAVLRRIVPVQTSHEIENAGEVNELNLGDIKILPKMFEAYFNNTLLTLTRKEFELLSYFVQNKGVILSRDQLLSAVWDYEFAGDTRIVDVHVARLRDKIELDKKNPRYIHTVRGFGYKMELKNE